MSPARLAPGRHLDIFNGLFRVNVDEVPLMGARRARRDGDVLDYTCALPKDARRVAAEQAHRGQLAIVTLDRGRRVQQGDSANRSPVKGQYARLALGSGAPIRARWNDSTTCRAR